MKDVSTISQEISDNLNCDEAVKAASKNTVDKIADIEDSEANEKLTVHFASNFSFLAAIAALYIQVDVMFSLFLLSPFYYLLYSKY